MAINEAAIRLGASIGVFVAMALWEAVAPRRQRSYSRARRWPSNLAIVALNTALVRILLPATAVSLALLGAKRGWGLLNNIPLPEWTAIVGSVVLLDLAIYLQHLMFHAVPALWRLHRMHHADLDFDVTAGARFHPIEIVLSMLIKFGVVVALGAPALAVLIFEVLLNATSMFNHGNVRLPAPLDRYLRWLVVTPDMHRVHHSIVVGETNSNFGFNLPCWDRLLGTYRDQPVAGHDGMIIGIKQFRESRELWLDRMFLQPFRGPAGEYPITWRSADMNKRRLIYRLTLVVALVAAISWLAFHRKFFAASALEQELQRFGRWAPVLFIGLYAMSTLLFVPGSVLTLVGGALFGPVWGTLWNLTGATLGATLAFVTARYVASNWVLRTRGRAAGSADKGG